MAREREGRRAQAGRAVEHRHLDRLSHGNDVAAELTRVTWPTRETVMNGTLVVVVASTVATVYVAILDKFGGFVTTLVYGA